MSFVIKGETREESLFSVQRCSVSTCLTQAQLVQDNVIFGTVSPLCDKCGIAEISLSHLLCLSKSEKFVYICGWFSKNAL